MSEAGSGPKTVAITAGTSFTGLWIAEALHQKGWQVHALCSNEAASYVGLRAARLRLLMNWARVHEEIRAEDGSMAAWIAENQPRIWIHHHHFMEKFREAAYDTARAAEVGVRPLQGIARALADASVLGVIYSGSYFEAGEGGQSLEAEVTPYARSKKEAWDALCSEIEGAGLHLGRMAKIVIPNPIGPLENDDRLIPRMLEAARTHETMRLAVPDAIGDHLPVEELGAVYCAAAEALMRGDSAHAAIYRPSGQVASVRTWAETVNVELIARRLGLQQIGLEIPNKREIASVPVKNFRNPASEARAIDWKKAWNHYQYWLSRASGTSRT